MPTRVEMTLSCRDSDFIPKVPNAGEIMDENGRSVQIMHNGVRVMAGGYHGDWMAEIIKGLRGHHEPQEELLFHEILKHIPPKAIMVELGGFWSYYSLWFLNDAPELRRSIVVEPDPSNLSVGRINAVINGRQIEFVQASVGEGSTEPRPFTTETAGIISIPQVSVPDLLVDRGIDHLDILHCDTQGAETGVIRSCERLMREHHINFVVVSTHAYQISGDPLTHQRCLSMLQDFGGRILAEHDVHESFSGDGLIVAYFGVEPIDWPELKLSYNRYSNSLFPNPLHDLDEAYSRISALQEQLFANTNRRDEYIRSLEGRLEALEPALRAVEHNLLSAVRSAEAAKRECKELKDANASIRSSTSWKATAPLRALMRILGLRRRR